MLLICLVIINNLTIFMKVISRYQTMVHYSCRLSAMDRQLQNLISVCVTIGTAKLIRSWLCISIIHYIH